MAAPTVPPFVDIPIPLFGSARLGDFAFGRLGYLKLPVSSVGVVGARQVSLNMVDARSGAVVPFATIVCTPLAPAVVLGATPRHTKAPLAPTLVVQISTEVRCGARSPVM